MTDKQLASINGGRNVEQFDPERYRLKQAALDYGIEEAKRIKDWPKLEEAVDLKIDEQRKFVAWWDAVVAVGKGKRTELYRAPGKVSWKDAEHLTGMRQQRVSDLGGRLNNIVGYRLMLLGVEYVAAMLEARDAQLNQQSLSSEHYTPAAYIAAARAVLGGIDLDPASCAEANETVGAAEYYDLTANGLVRPWPGRVWLNPPYGIRVGKFIAKLITELAAGNTSAAIVLVNAHCTDTAWFQPLWNGLLCFTDHRINFSGDDTRSGSTHGSVFIYFGDRRAEFIREFSKFGAVVERAKV